MTLISILIVEDELLLAKNLSRKLEKLGYNVLDIVSSGNAAIERAAELQPDLILMDIVIKGEMDGIETATQIQQAFDIPVIYTTAYADDETLERAEKTSCYGYVIKPFKERDLHATIKMAIKKHQDAVKMRESLAAAEAINEDKSRYLSMASHDLRTPLMTISMSADMLQRYGDKWTSEQKTKHFSRIQTAIKDMNQLLEDVLILSRADSGKIVFNPQPLEVVEFCQHILDKIKPLLSEKHFLSFVTTASEFQANIDEKLLQYCLTNLLTNAIKYSPNGGKVILEVKIDHQELIFQIKDEGIGIPPEDKKKLFQQFERASNVGDIKGTGLGLCIVKQVVDLHKGSIYVESEMGVGTTFTVILPI